MSWQFRGQFLLFTKIIALKTSVKSVTVAFIVKYICKLKWTINQQHECEVCDAVKDKRYSYNFLEYVCVWKGKTPYFLGYHVLYACSLLGYQIILKSVFFRFMVQLNVRTPPSYFSEKSRPWEASLRRSLYMRRDLFSGFYGIWLSITISCLLWRPLRLSLNVSLSTSQSFLKYV